MVAATLSVGEEPAGTQSATRGPDGGTRMSSGMLAGRHAVVTGGGRGIGAAIARALAAEGARVSLIGRDNASLQATAAAITAELPGCEARGIAADVSDGAAVRAALDAARA